MIVNKRHSIVSFTLYKILGCYFIVAVLVSGMILMLSYRQLVESEGLFVTNVAALIEKQLMPVMGNHPLTQAVLNHFLLNDAGNVDILGIEYQPESSSSSLFVYGASDIHSSEVKRYTFDINESKNILSLYVSNQSINHRFLNQFFLHLALLVGQLLLLLLFVKYSVVNTIKRSIDIMMRELRGLSLKKPMPLQGDPGLSRFREYQRFLSGVNRIIQDVISSRQELADLNKNLETKVREKTASLEEKNTALLQLNQKLSIMANTDALTQVYNRTRFELMFREHVEVATRRLTHLAILLIDLDDFKSVNDRFGHQVGDHVLKHTAQLLSECIGEEGMIARWGGEEFAVLLPYYCQDKAKHMAELLRCALGRVSFEEQRIGITMSVGVAQLQQGETSMSLLKRADFAMYRAKHNGKNRVALATPLSQAQLSLSGVPDSIHEE